MFAGHRGVEWSWCGVSPGRFYHWLYGNLLLEYNCKSEILCARFSDILFALIGLAFAAACLVSRRLQGRGFFFLTRKSIPLNQ